MIPCVISNHSTHYKSMSIINKSTITITLFISLLVSMGVHRNVPATREPFHSTFSIKGRPHTPSDMSINLSSLHTLFDMRQCSRYGSLYIWSVHHLLRYPVSLLFHLFISSHNFYCLTFFFFFSDSAINTYNKPYMHSKS